jgi:hypothetical protein
LNNTIFDFQDALKQKQADKTSLIAENKRAKEAITGLQEKQETYAMIDILAKQAKQATQESVAEELSDIASEALYTVFAQKFEQEKEDVFFDLRFTETGGCEVFFVDEEDNEFPVLGSRGFGLVDVVCASLRTSFLLFQDSRKLVVHDEPMRFVSKAYHKATQELFKLFAEEFGIQYIILTNEKGLLEDAPNVFKVSKKNKKSIIEKSKGE